MKTLGEILPLTTQFFKDKQISKPRRVAEELLSHVLHLPRLELYLQFERPLEPNELELLRGLVKRKVQGEPLEYMLGKVAFYQCDLQVDKRVLIPRPETEILLDKVCTELCDLDLKGQTALDLCTGSGCLGLGLKRALPKLSVVLADLSEEALQLAAQNAEKNGVQVELVQGDLLSPLEGRRFDVVLCNPPYVTEAEYAVLDPSVRSYEPMMALVGGEDGLHFYRRLSRELPAYLQPGAKIYFEIGATQGEAVKELFTGGAWRAQRLEKDWAGHDRFFFLEFE